MPYLPKFKHFFIAFIGLLLLVALPSVGVLIGFRQAASLSENTILISADSPQQTLSVGIIGGSFATELAKPAYTQWVKALGIDYTTYAKGGAGFVQGKKNFLEQARQVGVHDIYIIWCSTNDFVHSIPIGTKADIYGKNKTIWANFKEIIRILYEKNPKAKIALFTSSPHLASSQGNEEEWGKTTTHKHTLKEHVEAQKQMAAFYSLPCLDQYNNAQQNSLNYTLVCKNNDFHLTPYGYSLLVNRQTDFLSKL